MIGSYTGKVALQHAPTAMGQTVPPPKHGRRVLLAIGALVLVGGAAAATAIALTRGRGATARGSDAAIAKADATLVVALAPDAAAIDATAVDAEDEHGELRAKMRQLALAKDYFAILQIADLDADDPDPELANILADARKHYLFQQAHLIDVEVAMARCAKAREIAATAQKVIPEDTTLVAKAKACRSRTPEPAYDAAADLKTGDSDYAHGDFAGALAAAEKVIDKQPTSEPALKLATIAACGLKDQRKARLYYLQLDGPDRNFALYKCKSTGVTPTAEEAVSGGTPPAKHEIKQQLQLALDALKANDLDGAQKIVDKVMKIAPKHQLALEIQGRIACRRHDKTKARQVISQLPLARAAIVRQVCTHERVFTETDE